MDSKNRTRREFITSAAALSAVLFMTLIISSSCSNSPIETEKSETMPNPDMGKEESIIGKYGSWADDLVRQPQLLSLKNEKWTDIESWKTAAVEKTKELLFAPGHQPAVSEPIVTKTYINDSLIIEELEGQLPYCRKTKAILLKPENATDPLPAILALHGHRGSKYFGKRKITKISDQHHPAMQTHQESYYAGFAWANEIAIKGYVVLVHDTFRFASRRVLHKDMASIDWGYCWLEGKSDENLEKQENIDIYTGAGEHEHIMAKSLFSARTTRLRVILYEDQKALDILCSRSEVDNQKVGCCGLSGGGLRTNFWVVWMSALSVPSV